MRYANLYYITLWRYCVQTDRQKCPSQYSAPVPEKEQQYNGWLRGTVVERRFLAGKLSLSHARLAADGWPLLWVNHPLQVRYQANSSFHPFRVDN